jgi:threonylcarbamoyladenosine tRNA methylthiotransferase MtaB
MHLPIQSGADSVLRRMARRCKTTEFSHLVQQARAAIPDFNVTTDIIVGFPGETEAEWQETLGFVEQIGFGHVHIFTYSPRAGTKAAGLANPVAENIKKQRSQALHELAEQSQQAWLQQQLGKSVPVLWERSREQDGQLIYTGYTPNYCKVITSPHAKTDLENQITTVRLALATSEEGVLQGV